jgi:hypothetical protein
MHTPNEHEHNSGHEPDQHVPDQHVPEKIDASHGYERTDVGITGVIVFLTALAILVVVAAVLCYGIGKAINYGMDQEDGPNKKWTKTADVRELGNLANNPEIQSKVAQLTQQFPTPRLLIDDGNQDVADLHQREDLLLDHYSKIDGQPDKVRIPIEKAIELIASQGLQQAPAAETAKPLTGDSVPVVTAPLTDGFARTAFEQDLAAQKKAEQARPE